MATTEKVLVPDIGGAEDVDVIEILVKPGDTVAVEDPLITLEGDKATMEVPSSHAGVVDSIALKVGDKVSQGSVILVLATEAAETKSEPQSEAKPEPSANSTTQTITVQTIAVPDIGGASNVDVIEVNVSVGDELQAEDPMITLEGDKATMEVPAPLAGKVTAVMIKVGDKVSQGDDILQLEVSAAGSSTGSAKSTATAGSKSTSQPAATTNQATNQATKQAGKHLHASPIVRRLAREFDIDLQRVPATGPKGRITKEDMQRYVKQRLAQAESGGSGFNWPSAPKVDFDRFGPTERKALSKIKKISGGHLHRNWVSIPHVTQFNEADITDMEAFRQEQKAAAAKKGVKLTPLVFIMKAAAAALKEYPIFNASLDSGGDQLIVKKYFHIGVAVDTPQGLVVPVVRDVDQKGLLELAQELAEISNKARTTGLGIADMQGGCFTISSLGGIGGTAFTPIINAPEVAILGVSRSQQKPIYQPDGNLAPRLMLPLSLSYDHRVVDGADGARFIMYLSKCLMDFRTSTL